MVFYRNNFTEIRLVYALASVCLKKPCIKLLNSGKAKGLDILLPLYAYGMRVIVGGILSDGKIYVRSASLIIMNNTRVKV